jgi:hypothetical protein
MLMLKRLRSAQRGRSWPGSDFTAPSSTKTRNFRDHEWVYYKHRGVFTETVTLLCGAGHANSASWILVRISAFTYQEMIHIHEGYKFSVFGYGVRQTSNENEIFRFNPSAEGRICSLWRSQIRCL